MHSKFRPRPSFEQIRVGNDRIPFSPSASNLSVIMDETLVTMIMLKSLQVIIFSFEEYFQNPQISDRKIS